MATIVLAAAGAAIGSSIGGAALGVSAAVIGRAVGATIGQAIDQKILGSGSAAVETAQVDRFRLTNASEGAAVPNLFGRMRIAGQVIWSSRFWEAQSTSGGGGGKGSPSRPKVTSYSYSVSLAIALCEGRIQSVGRIWADGMEISPSELNLRIYHGSDDQLPDPKIQAVEGADRVPAFRGTAYVVIEDLDLGRFGNRVPQFSFEVMRSAQPDPHYAPLSSRVRGVAMIPGTGEYALASQKVHWSTGPGVNAAINVNTPTGESDFNASLTALQRDLPNCHSVSLVVSWFGDDLRAGDCRLKPKVDQTQYDASQMTYRVGSRSRYQLETVPKVDGAQIYGGTPCDESVTQAIQSLHSRGKSVVFYPFILMDQIVGNTRPDPYSGAGTQAELPWRGRITTSKAPGQPGSTDGTAAAEAEVAAFFGTTGLSDLRILNGKVVWESSVDWRYRHFILHYAHLCAQAGGVDAFCIGSEMRGLTQIRGSGNSFPAVQAMKQLAADVRAILGPHTKIGYAADWSEYFGYHPRDGSGDVFFHLDPLWADPNIDFIGIDNYMPLSDWRDGRDHADGAFGSPYNQAYLRSQVAGGEGFDWYYANESDRAAQVRTPIEDGLAGEPWVFRYKDLRGWWSHPHHNRIGGVRQGASTEWQPESKPIWFTEIGCAAIDKGTNQPNKFIDLRSSESAIPWFSNGRRDDLVQHAYYDATLGYWDDPSNNPVSGIFGGRMLDVSRSHAWAWDARPWPYFPNNSALWSDSPNYARGHWIEGRITAQSLGAVVREICARAGVTDVDVSELSGLVRGYVIDEVSTPRAALQPLMVAFGFEAVERNGRLYFHSRKEEIPHILDAAELAVAGDTDGVLQITRAPEVELPDRIQLRYVEHGGDYSVRSAEAVFPEAGSVSVSQSSFPLALTYSEGKAITERWLTEARVARETAQFSVPPSRVEIKAGDVVRLTTAQGTEDVFRIDRIEEGRDRQLDAVRVSNTLYQPADTVEELPPFAGFTPPLPVFPLLLDLPLLTGDEVPYAPWLAVSARPWPGRVAVYSAPEDSGYAFERFVETPSTLGVTETPLHRAAPGRWDRGAPLRVALTSGTFDSTTQDKLLRGANLLAIGDGSPSGWELLQFRDAVPVAPGVFELSMRLRGQQGTDVETPDVWPEGSLVVLLDGTQEQVDLSSQSLGYPRHFRIGPAQSPLDDDSYDHVEAVFTGIGLRPLSPAHLKAVPSGGDIRVSFIRRTRINGDRWDLDDVPLGETTERYVVRVRGADGSLLREVTVAVPEWLYTQQMFAEDGQPSSLVFEVAQVSDRYGPGAFERIHYHG